MRVKINPPMAKPTNKFKIVMLKIDFNYIISVVLIRKFRLFTQKFNV